MNKFIEMGIIAVINQVPVYGQLMTAALMSSGGLSVAMSGLGSILTDAMYHGMTMIILKQTGEDIYSIIMGTCIKRPVEYSWSMKNTYGEVESGVKATGDATSNLYGYITRHILPTPPPANVSDDMK
jgi:hypothetical protein